MCRRQVCGNTVQPLPGGEVVLLVARFLFSHFSYQGYASGPVRPVQTGSGQGDDAYALPHRRLQLEGGREGWVCVPSDLRLITLLCKGRQRPWLGVKSRAF